MRGVGWEAHVTSRDPTLDAVATVFFFKKNKVTRVAQRYAACQKKSGITRFARPSALIPFFSGTPLRLRGWVTRALQGKVLVVMGVGRLACGAGH